jgi:orotidine-5'-phosphate decarboxylase
MSDRRNFRHLIEKRWADGKFVYVGLDSEFGKIPASVRSANVHIGTGVFASLVAFNRAIVEATHEFVCAYKPNSAFYEAYGAEGFDALQQTIADINVIAPDVPVILDAKRGDIGNTNIGYATAAFDILKADAITVNPYFGRDALQPFLTRADKGIFVLCRTSNPGSDEFQKLGVQDSGILRLYRVVAKRVAADWNGNNNCGLVVGAPYPDELGYARRAAPRLPILIPGIGAQGGDLEKAVAAGVDAFRSGIIINSSRGIIFASSESDFAEAARRESMSLHAQVRACIENQRK